MQVPLATNHFRSRGHGELLGRCTRHAPVDVGDAVEAGPDRELLADQGLLADTFDERVSVVAGERVGG